MNLETEIYIMNRVCKYLPVNDIINVMCINKTYFTNRTKLISHWISPDIHRLLNVFSTTKTNYEKIKIFNLIIMVFYNNIEYFYKYYNNDKIDKLIKVMINKYYYLMETLIKIISSEQNCINLFFNHEIKSKYDFIITNNYTFEQYIKTISPIEKNNLISCILKKLSFTRKYNDKTSDEENEKICKEHFNNYLLKYYYIIENKKAYQLCFKMKNYICKIKQFI
jgi:hypothetical protein